MNKTKISRTVTVISAFLLASLLSFVCLLLLLGESSVEPAYGVALDTYEQRTGDSYYHFNPAHIFDENGQSDTRGGITGGAVTIIDFIITKIGLPLGIIMSTWRVIYLAIFPLIMGTDPLLMMRKARYRGVQRGKADSYQEKAGNWDHLMNGGETRGNADTDIHNKWTITDAKASESTNTSISYQDFINNNRQQENVVNYIKQELKFMLLGLFVTFTVWGLLKLCMMAAMAFLNVADSAATGMTS